MFQETFEGDSRELQWYLKENQRCFKDVFRKFQGCLRKFSREFQGCLKKVQGSLKKDQKKRFQGRFDEGLLLQFCWCIDLIAAYQAEGGLVCWEAAF